MGGWRSVWSAAPSLPSALLCEIARRAGVHVYSDAGDQVFRSQNLLAVHAFSDGKRTIRLPESMDVRDAFTEETLALHATEFVTNVQRGDTPIWEIQTNRGQTTNMCQLPAGESWLFACLRR